MQKITSTDFIGLKLFQRSTLDGYVQVEHCFDITEDLPPGEERHRQDRLYLGFGQGDPGDYAIQIIFRPGYMGSFRWMSEIQTRVTRSESSTPVFSDPLVFQLKNFGLSPERFTELAEQAFAQIPKTQERV